MSEAPAERDTNLVLIGPMGAGKSSIARRIAVVTGRRMVDTDNLVRREQGGRTIAEIFAREGENFFRERETAALASVPRNDRLIVATGGGIVTLKENRALLRLLGIVFWLTASEDVLFERVSRHRERPLLLTADPRLTLRDLLSKREPLYRECADCVIDSSDLEHASVADAMIEEARRLSPGIDLPCRAPQH